MNIKITSHKLTDQSEVFSVDIESNGMRVRLHVTDYTAAHILKLQLEENCVDIDTDTPVTA